MKKLYVLALIFTTSLYALEKEYWPVVQKFIDLVKNNKIEELANNVAYPLRREYPLPPISSPEDFVKKFNQLFEKELIDTITKSDYKKDWEALGWRGIMLNNGILWITSEGKLSAINRMSAIELENKAQIIEEQKSKLHTSVKKFDVPCLEGQTKKFLIRIDKMDTEKYRYAAWSLPKTFSDKPDLILYNGTMEPQGSGGICRDFSFKNKNYKYLVETFIDEGTIEVFKNDTSILNEKFDKLTC